MHTDTPDNEVFRLYKEMADEMTEASVPGTFLVDIFPLRGSLERVLWDNDNVVDP
jgi:hypothetical protein